MRYGKMVGGGILVAAAGVLFLAGYSEMAAGVLPIGIGLLGVGAAHKLDKLMTVLGALRK